MLKHPYDRQPDGCRKEAIAVGSNLVLGDNYKEFCKINIPIPQDYNLDNSESFEWYSFRVERKLLHYDDLDLEEAVFEETQDVGQIQEDNDSKSEETSENNISDNEDLDAEEEESEETQDTDQIQEDNDKNSEESSEQNNENQDNEEDKVLIQVITMPDGSELNIYMENPSQPEANSSDTIDSGTTQVEGDKNSPQSGGKSSQSNRIRTFSPKANFDLSNLWEEDFTKVCEIDYQIEIINNSKSWGSLSGDLVNEILANSKARIDYRKVLSGFRASILSSKRSLTRMRPNRRSGFDNMGSIRRFNTNILVAVDVSGSVNDESLKHFYSIINRTFKYGIENLDCIQFDSEIKSFESLKKKQKSVAIKGRGGTNFQIVFDYAANHLEYDGLIIFTDGDAKQPQKSKKMKCKVAWVCNTKDGYDSNKSWMKKLGRCCLMEV